MNRKRRSTGLPAPPSVEPRDSADCAPPMRVADQPTPAYAVPPRVAHATILTIWVLYFLVNTARAAFLEHYDQLDMLLRRGCVTLVGIGLTYVIYLALRRMRGREFRTRAITAFSLCVPLALAYALVNYTAFFEIQPTLDTLKQKAEMAAKGYGPVALIIDSAINWYFMFGAWAALYLALVYASETRLAEQRAAAYAAAAQAAELRALRYQVNPHFLFNTLNSLSTLIMTGRSRDAESMILNLATFFRTSLASDPSADVTLAEEIRLQQLYLDIEKVRFPDRLLVRVDIPPALEDAKVPALILQPLVENAIKYGVSRARRPVTVTLRARQRGDELVLSVEDDGEGGAADILALGSGSTGTGMGLRNVRDRLGARFGPSARALWGPLTSGGYGAVLSMPLSLDPVSKPLLARDAA